MALTVFNYTDARLFLCDWLADRQKSEPRYSVRKWASELGISHALLVMILQGKRRLSTSHAEGLLKSVPLSTPEKAYFKKLVELAGCRSPRERARVASEIEKLNPDGQARVRDVEEFHHISSWLHMALLSFMRLREWDGSLQTLTRRFGKRAGLHEIRPAIERLCSLNLLWPDEDGILRPTDQRVSTRDDLASEAVRAYHRNAARLSIDAIETQSVDQREYQSFALAIDPAKLPIAKEMIRKFRMDLARALQASEHAEIYHVNLHLFRLTESPSLADEDEGIDTGAEPYVSSGEIHADV